MADERQAAIDALTMIGDRCPDLGHAAGKARKAVEVESPIRGKRMAAVMDDALHTPAYAAEFSEDEKRTIRRAAVSYFRAGLAEGH